MLRNKGKTMNFFDKIISLLYPPRCPYCRTIIEFDEYACKECIKEFPKTDIITGVSGYRCVSPFRYEGKYRKALCDFKFRNKKQYAPLFAQVMYNSIKRQYNDIEFDIVSCVPMHNKDLNKKGYNHSKLLAIELSKLLNIPYADTIEKTKRTKKQHKLPLNLRKTNLSGAFKLIDKDIVKGKRILFVDDVVTTGATLSNTCKVLQKSKPKFIFCITLAKTNV